MKIERRVTERTKQDFCLKFELILVGDWKFGRRQKISPI
jgi:hypothetical protein